MQNICCAECGESGICFEKINGELYCIDCFEEKMKKFLSYQDVVSSFEENFPPSAFYHGGIQIDHTERREAFNDYTDSLCKDGMISEEQYHNMHNPY